MPDLLPTWSTACFDWERRIVAGESLVPCEPLFPGEAEAGLEVFNALRAVDVADGTLTLGDISRPWVTAFVAAIFGAYDPESGRRLIREFFLLISKKNGKSTDAAGIMLTALLLNWRNGAEMGILAPTIEVANNAWRPLRDAIKADDELSALLLVQEHIRTVTHRKTGATLQVVAADSDTVSGKKWTVTLIDELWLFGKRATADKMLLEATGGMASRPEGFVIYLSTQSDEPPAGVFKEKLQYARDVRDGKVVDPAFLPVLYEFPAAMLKAKAYLDPANFYVTNPNLGASVDEEFLRRELMKAQRTGEQAIRIFLAKHVNVEIGLNLRADRWPGAEFWEGAAVEVFALEELIERSDIATIGIDGGGLDDLLGFCVIGRCATTGDWLAWMRAWAHPSVLERRKSEESKFRDFEADGDLVIVEEIGQDIDQLVAIVVQVHEAGLLERDDPKHRQALGVDPAGIASILDALEAAGIESDMVAGIPQGWRLNGAIKTAERRLAAKTLKHGGRPMGAWCAGNARTQQAGNAVYITKQASGTAKIDPLMAMFNAVELMSRAPAQNLIGDDYQLTVV